MTAFPAPTRRELLALLVAAPLAGGAAPYPVVPFKLQRERIAVPVAIGGRTFRFILDSGAARSGIALSVAEALKLPRVGVARMRGMNSSASLPAFVADTVLIGGAIARQDMTLVGFPQIEADGMGGLIGADILTAFDSSLDFDALEWRAPPRGAGATTGLARLESGVIADVQRGPRLTVQATVDGQPCRLVVDTGAPYSFLFGKTAKRLGYWDDKRPHSPMVTSDVFGKSLGLTRVIRAGRLDMSGIGFAAPLIALQDPSAPGVENIDGLLGLDLAQQINLAIDVRGASLWGKRNRRQVPPRAYNRSGLRMDADKDGSALVVGVGTGSPAALAGVQVGDRLPPGPGLGDALFALGGPAGAPIRFEVLRGGARRQINFTLRNYL